jgi:molybdenum cofactor cytidylyltransferase
MASGYSRRFDSEADKLLADFRGRPLFQWTLDLLATLPFLEVIVVARLDAILDYGTLKGYTCLRNDAAAEGMSASIRLGLRHASAQARGYMFFSADQPLLKEATVLALVNAFIVCDNKIVVPTAAGRRGSPTIFPVCYKEALLMLQGEAGGKKIIQQHEDDVKCVAIDDEASLMDIDTKADFLDFESRIK